jgi:hypothetical protein
LISADLDEIAQGRAAAAMHECRSNNFFALARVALKAAIGDEIDLLGLLPAPKYSPVKSTPVAAMALA